HWHDGAIGFSKPDQLVLPKYNEELLMKEAALFADWYMPQALGSEKAESLREEYMTLWKDILAGAHLDTGIWVHRDFHADNLMWLPQRASHKRVGLLDFQDGVYGDA